MERMSEYEIKDVWRSLRKAADERSRGYWAGVIKALCPGGLAAVEAWERNPRSAKGVPCPVHGSNHRHGDGLRCPRYFGESGALVCNTCGETRNGFETVMFLNGWSFKEAVTAVMDYWGIDNPFEPGKVRERRPVPEPVVYAPDPAEIAAEDEQAARRLVETWSESIPITDPAAGIAHRYLRSRGLTPIYGDFPALRFHPRLFWMDKETGEIRHFPAILCLTTYPDGTRVSIQRHYLDPEGRKAPVEPNRKMMPPLSTKPINGSATQLDPAGIVLAVAEGLESALSARSLSGLPTWACHSTTFLEHVQIPDHTRYVVVFGDKDAKGGGQRAATALVERLRQEGRRAVVYLPPFDLPADAKSVDWNDPVKDHGLEGARKLKLMDVLLRSLKEKAAEDGIKPADLWLPWAIPA
jgi:putative DNA primase/helicase